MKFLPLQIRSALGRRVLSQYLCIAMLPVAALAGLFYVQANAALQEARDQELAQAAHAYAGALKDRLIVAERAVDAQSLIALADLVVSAGGTMNREAAALGVPVYTTYGGRLGGVDEELIRDGRLKPLTDPRALDLRKRDTTAGDRVRRDPALMLQLLLSALPT